MRSHTSVAISARSAPDCAFAPAAEAGGVPPKLNAMTVAKYPARGGVEIHGRIWDVDLGNAREAVKLLFAFRWMKPFMPLNLICDSVMDQGFGIGIEYGVCESATKITINYFSIKGRRVA